MAQYLINSAKIDGEMVTVDGTVTANFDTHEATVHFKGSVHVRTLARMAMYQQKLVLANANREAVKKSLPKLASETDHIEAIKKSVEDLNGTTVDFARPTAPLPIELQELLIDCDPEYQESLILLYRKHGYKISKLFLETI